MDFVTKATAVLLATPSGHSGVAASWTTRGPPTRDDPGRTRACSSMRGDLAPARHHFVRVAGASNRPPGMGVLLHVAHRSRQQATWWRRAALVAAAPERQDNCDGNSDCMRLGAAHRVLAEARSTERNAPSLCFDLPESGRPPRGRSRIRPGTPYRWDQQSSDVCLEQHV